MSSAADVDKHMLGDELSCVLKFQPRRTEPRPLSPRCRLPSRGARGSAQRAYELKNGQWLATDGFRPGTRYVVDGRLTQHRPRKVDSVVDLAGPVGRPALRRGAQPQRRASRRRPRPIPSSPLPTGRRVLREEPGHPARGAAMRSPAASTSRHGVDAVFANGLLTATGGHPTGLYLRNLSRGGDDRRRRRRRGPCGSSTVSPTSSAKWPRIVAGRPGLHQGRPHSLRGVRCAGAPTAAFFNWRGLDPALVPEIVRRAHAAGCASPRTSRPRPTSAPRSPAARTRSITSPASAATSASSSPSRSGTKCRRRTRSSPPRAARGW